MSGYYTPTLEELKEAWVRYRTFIDYERPPEDAGAEFDRTMDEFGNEQYEDGISSGYNLAECYYSEGRECQH